MRFPSSSAFWPRLGRSSLLFAVTLSVALGANPSVPSPTDPDLARLERAIAEHPDGAAARIARTRYRFAKLNQGRPDIGDNPLTQDYGADDRAFADALQPILTELDADVEHHRRPESAALLIERARVRLVYQAHFSGRSGRAFLFEETVTDLIHATELEPANAAAWYELGLAHLALWGPDATATTGPNLLWNDEERYAGKKAALYAFSRAILAQPDHSGFAHLLRLWTQRAMKLGADPDQMLADADAIIGQDLAPTDAAWDAVLHPARPAAKRADYLAETYYLRGQVRVSRGEFSAALADLDQALALEPTNLSVRLERGRLLVRRGDYAQAIVDLTAMVTAQPNFAEGWFWRGIAHDGAGEIELARADFDQATKHDKNISRKLAHTRYDPVAPDPARGLAPAPVTADAHPVRRGTALDHKNAGNALRGKGNDYGALREYGMALMIDPTFADGYNNRGSSYRAWQEIDLALADFNRAIELDPTHRAAYLNRALLWHELRDHARARADCDHAVDYADSDYLRGQALLARGRMKEIAQETKAAEADYRRATEVTPTDGAAWSTLALLEFNQSRFPVATEHFRQSLTHDPKNVTNRVYLAVVLAIERDKSAGDELDTAIRDHTRREQMDEATRIVDRALKIYPGSSALQALKDKITEQKKKSVLFV